MSLNNIRIVHSPLTDTFYLARFGVNPTVALEKRECEAELMAALIQHMTDDFPNGSGKEISINGQRYAISVKPCPPPETDE